MDSAGNCIERYQQGMMIDGIAGRQIGQGTLSDRYIKDHIGSVQRVIRENGTEENEYIYDSFGNLVYTSGTLSNQRLYTSRYYDSETGLYYYRARYYDSNTGRFVSEDPIGFWGGVNLYRYVQNNPLNYTDPFGLKSEEECLTDCKKGLKNCLTLSSASFITCNVVTHGACRLVCGRLLVPPFRNILHQNLYPIHENSMRNELHIFDS